MKNLFPAILMLLLMSSCSFFTPVNVDENKYVLNQYPKHFPAKRTHHAPLLILYPQTVAVYNTKKIAYRRHSDLIDYYTKNQWDATPAQMLYPLMVLSFQKSHYFKSIVTPPYPGKDYFTFKTELIDFFWDFSQHAAIVKITARLQLMHSWNDIIKTRLVTIEEPVINQPPYGGIIATNRAVERLLREMVRFAD